MTRTLCIATLAVVTAAAIGADAQTTSSRPPLVTVTGCVERGATQSATETTGTTGTAQAPGPDTKFVLANVTTETKPAGTAGGERAGTISDSRSYRLDNADESKIAPHVGQRVEISGTVEEQTAPAVGTTGSTATADAISPKLKVDTIRVVASDCSKR